MAVQARLPPPHLPHRRRRQLQQSLNIHATIHITPAADNPLVSLAVGAMTEGLRLAGVG